MAENGKEALEVLEERHDEIAVMLLDLLMPVADGFEVLERVKEKPWGQHLAIVIISTESPTKAERRCFDLGVADFIHRPFDAKLVQRRVQKS